MRYTYINGGDEMDSVEYGIMKMHESIEKRFTLLAKHHGYINNEMWFIIAAIHEPDDNDYTDNVVLLHDLKNVIHVLDYVLRELSIA